MSFIKKNDFRITIQENHLDQLTGADDTILERAIYEGTREVESYLQNAYDITAIFVDYPDFGMATPFTADSYAWDSDYLYKCVIDNTGNLPNTDDGTNWVKEDPRNPRLIQVLRDVVLYHLHSAIAAHNVPEVRETRYKDGLQWLRDLRSGDVATSLPKPTDADGENTSEFPSLNIISSRPSEGFYY